MQIKNLQINDRGSALVVALFFVAILTVIGLALMFNTSLDNVISNNYAKTVRATYTATSGIERFKAYLLYDYKHDPKGWSNQYIVVPQGTTYADGTLAQPASQIGASGSDAYLDMNFAGNTATIPSTTPYKINPNIRYVADPTMYAEVAATPGNPITPGSGYQIMLRNLANVQGGTCSDDSTCDPNSIFVLGIGRTTTTKAYLGSTSRGMNLIEDGIFGDDVSVWNNIFFSGSNSLSGGGAMTIHGNVHILGKDPPAGTTEVVLDVKADILNSYYYSNANKSLKDPLMSTISLPQQRHPDDGLLPAFATDPVNNLRAKVRVRNGLIDLSLGNARIGEPTTDGILFDVIATCRTCPTPPNNSNGFTEANPQAYAAQFKNYSLPANLQPLIKVPLITDQYTDPSNNLIYSNYTDYFIGVRSASPNNLPGAMGLRLATALGNNSTMSFEGTSLAALVWNNRNAIFTQNVNDALTNPGTSAREQQGLDPVDTTGVTEPDPLFSPVIGSGPTDGKTFMLVAADLTLNVVLVYKEVAPFERDVPATVAFPRVVHGFVFVPPGITAAQMDTLNLQFDLDGDGTILNPGLLDFPDTDGTTYGAAHTIADASNKLLRKVTNAIWEAGRGECGVLGPCYNNASKDSWEASMFHPDGNNTDLFDDITANSPINLKASRLIAIGAIETTDTLNLGDNVLYAGRYTFYARDSDSGGAGVGRINWYGNSYAIPSYRYPPTSLPATYVAFPCQNVMGLMTPEDIDDSNTAPGDDLQGAFYATGVIHLTKQHQIMGAMVSAAWDFGTGGNPDYFQAMEISRCLPPYIIAKDVIVFADSVSWLER